MPLRVCAALAILMAAVGVHDLQADEINFDAQAAAMNAPSVADGVLNSPLTIGIATFTGGELFLNESYSTDQTGVYATSSEFNGYHSGWNYADYLKITFSQPVSGFSVLVTNSEPIEYTATDNFGESVSAGPGHTFAFSDVGITSVTIDQTLAPNSGADFAIDNVMFTPIAVPEPCLLLLPGLAFAALVYSRHRRRMCADVGEMARG